MNHDEYLDNFLDEALSEYGDIEPLSGLENRVLRRVVQAGEEHRIPWLRWAIAATCAALVAFGIWFSVPRRTTETHPHDALAAAKPAQQAPSQAPAPVVSAPAVTTHRVNKTVKAAPVSVPTAIEARGKPTMFPLPTSLTPAEREFMAALQRGPKALPNSLEESEPVTIAEIEIKPLTIGGISSSENPGEKQ